MQLKTRIIALPLAAVLAAGTFFHSAPAQAAPKSKTYKAGAIALGALGAYFLSKGKTVEGAAALGGGYLAYKQGEKERKNERYGSNWDNDRFGRNDNWNTNNGRNNNWNTNSGRNDNWNTNNGRNNNWDNGWDGNNDYRYNNSSYGNSNYRSNGRSWQR